MTDQDFIDALKAIGHPSRLKILEAISEEERNVSQLEEASGISQPALSQQLAVLRKAGLVRTRKDAKLVYYSLESERFEKLTSQLLAFQSTADAPAPRKNSSSGAANFARLA